MINWKESDLFNWLQENVYPDLVKAKNQMSRWDCYSPATGHRLELKCRKAHYNTLLLCISLYIVLAVLHMLNHF